MSTVKPNFGPGLAERILDAINTSEEHVDACESVKAQLREALGALLGVINSCHDSSLLLYYLICPHITFQLTKVG